MLAKMYKIGTQNFTCGDVKWCNQCVQNQHFLKNIKM